MRTGTDTNTFRRVIKLAADTGKVEPPKEIELLQTGEWDAPWHGHFVIDDAALAEYVKNFDEGVRKGVPIDREHMSMSEEGAAGWIEKLEIRDTESPAFPGQKSLWGSVAWTPTGEQKIKDREFRFFSPEFADEDYQDPETGEYMNNVLVGGGLTNRPLFKKLKAIAASENKGGNKKVLTAKDKRNIIYLTMSDALKLEDVVKKDPKDLTEDEQKFLQDNASDLSDEQKETFKDALEAGGEPEPKDPGEPEPKDPADPKDPETDPEPNDPDPADPKKGNEGKPKTVTMSEAEVKQLQADAAAGKEAHETLARKASEEHIGTLCFSDKSNRDSGKFPVTLKKDLTELYHSMNDKQRTAFDAIAGKMPSLKLFGEIGTSSAVETGSAQERVLEAAEKIVEESKDKSLTRSAAITKVLANDKELAAEYKQEREDLRKGGDK